MKAEQFIDSARALIGTPFHHQGRVTAGVDCLGLVVLAAKNCGMVLEDKTDYPRQSQGSALASELARQCDVIASPRKGCLIHFRWGKATQHIAVWTGDTVVHALESVGKVVEHRLSEDYEKAIVAYYWIKGLEE